MNTPEVKTTDVLSEILNEHGMVYESQMARIVASYPDMTLCAKMGASMRFTAPASQIQAQIAQRIAACPEHEYVRELFITAQSYDALRALLGFAKETY